MLPRVEFPPFVPFTFHETALLVAFCTIAAKATTELAGQGVMVQVCTMAVVGVTLTVIGGGIGSTVIVAVRDTDVSAAAPAYSVKEIGLATVGAV
jgi:hypothetical protein